MKKILLSICLSGFMINTFGQAAVTDTVSTGAQYSQQVWYNLATGQQTSTSAKGWDIAFPTNNRSVAVRINDGGGVHLWKDPNGDQTSWATVDTTNMSNWKECYNSESDWDFGAFNDNLSSAQFDYGWGTYDVSDHHIRANSVFVIQTADGNFKKIMIEDLDAVAGIYYFKYADLDGSNEISDTLDLADFSGKNFAYYSLQTNQELNPEPHKTDWDLLFTQYTSMIPAGPDTIAYVVTGVISNINEGVAKVEGVDVNSYDDYQGQTLDSAKNVIGYDWKSYDMNSGAYHIADSTLFFVQDKSKNIWKVVFTGFGGSANGNFILNKEQLSTTSIKDAAKTVASLALYPNPVINGRLTIAFNLDERAQNVFIGIYDLSGRMVYQQQSKANAGMNQQNINTANWANGTYIVKMTVAGQTVSQKAIIY